MSRCRPIWSRASLPWALSLLAHLAFLLGVLRAGGHAHPSRQAITVDIVERRPTPEPPRAVPAERPVLARPPVRLRARAAPRLSAPAPMPVPAASETAAILPAPPPAPPAPPAPLAPVVQPALAAVAHAPSTGVDLSGYLGIVNQAVAKRRRYPQMAIELSLEGIVEVRVRVSRDGKLAARPVVLRSSGHELLDDEAVEMVSRAAPFPPLPAGYESTVAEFRVPVRFYLN